VWLDTESQWDRLAAALIKAKEFGIDTETWNQPDRTSPQWRTKVHCWSVGLLTNKRSPRGYRLAVGRVLPGRALQHRSLREVLESAEVKKFAHNAPHDIHSIINEGVSIRACEDSLQMLRVACPGRIGYGLKEAEIWALGLGPRPSFIETVTHEVDVVTARSKKHKACLCGKQGCRAKQTSDFLSPEGLWLNHLRVTWRVITPIHKTVEARWEVPEFVPGHPRWLPWLEYSLADAVHGMELVDWVRNLRPTRVAYPWTGLQNSAA
jgi:hypothetical protein